MLSISEVTGNLLLIFVLTALGYLVGRIRIKGVTLGSSGIFFVALVFGHFGFSLPPVIQSLGVVLFISAVGSSAGPAFVRNLKANGPAYLAICVVTILTGAVLSLLIILLAGLHPPLVMGLITGAYTSSPGFASAKEAVLSFPDGAALVSAGYGLMYPLGTVGKVLFVQLVPKLLHADMDRERALVERSAAAPAPEDRPSYWKADPNGWCVLAVLICLGALLGSITFPIPFVGKVCLGLAGGPLIVALLFGALGHLGPVSLEVSPTLITPLRDLGALLFYVTAGTEGGHSIVRIALEYGPRMAFFGILLTLVPMLCGFLCAYKLFRIPLLNSLAVMTGGMTSTPALAVLVQTAGTDAIAATYATVYPVALINMVVLMQLFGAMC